MTHLRSLLQVGAAAFLLLTSCSTKEEASSTLPTAGPVIVDPSQVNGTTSNAVGTSIGTGMLNPAHGEPGHRCDIAVGEPLDGAPPAPGASTSGPMGSQTLQIGGEGSAVNMPPTTTLGSGKINPAHGEPGHDCAVPVGDPLP